MPRALPPRCGCGKFLGTTGCEVCRVFQCPRCRRVVPWAEGGTDDLNCATCWKDTTGKNEED